jgi:phosphoribosylaminoimidazole-succinocarboxamide synthase
MSLNSEYCTLCLKQNSAFLKAMASLMFNIKGLLSSFLLEILTEVKKRGYMDMIKKEQLYEGKAKKVFATDNPELLVVSYKDDATAFNGLKKGTIMGKGIINNIMTNRLMQYLENFGIPTHFVKELSERETLVKKVSIIPLEVIVRNISAGSFSKRYGVEEGIVFEEPTIEFSYKNDELGDPLINDYHAIALKLATREEIEKIKNYSFMVNERLKDLWKECGVTLVDFKLEFGKTSEGSIVLADEISPDTCRLWDSKTGEKLDKDRFRRDLGGVEAAYQEIMRRLKEHA